MNLKRLIVPWGIVAVVIVAVGAGAWLVSSHYIVPKFVDHSAEVDGRTQGLDPTENSVLGAVVEPSQTTAEDALKSESLNGEGSERGLPSGDGQVSAPQDGYRTAGVVVQDNAATPGKDRATTGDNVEANVNSKEQGGSNLSEPGRIDLVVDEAQSVLPDTGPGPTSGPDDIFQASTAPIASDLLAFVPTPETSLEESGETSVHFEYTGQSLSPDLQHKGEGGDDQVTITLEKKKLKYPNLSSQLNQLVASFESGQATAEQAARGAAINQGGSVAVTIYLSDHVNEVVTFLEDNGADPRNVGEDYIEAYVPVPLLGPVSGRPGVIRVREIIPPQAGQAGAPSRP